MPPERRQHPCAEAGFTLIELLVVLAVLGLSLGLVLQRGPSRSAALDVRAAAGEMAEALRGARGRAIATNRTVAVALDLDGGRYRVGDGPQRALPSGLRLSMTAAADRTAGRAGAIDFLPDGSASGGRIGLAAGETRLWVGVDWLTGRVGVSNVP